MRSTPCSALGHALALALAGMAVLAGCTTNPDRPRSEASELVEGRAGIESPITIEQDEASRTEVRDRVRELLAKPLTVDSALRIALLNNPGLAADLEELGVAQADLVQAGLLQNPVIGGDLVVSTKGFGLGGGLSLSQSLLSVFLIPAKRKIAKNRRQQAVLSASNATLVLIRDVKTSFVEVQAATRHYEVARKLTQAAEVADELAQRQREAGNLTELDREQIGAALDHARLELSETELDLVEVRESFNRLLGLWGDMLDWRIDAPLMEPPDGEPDFARLEARGIRDRLDLSAARFETDAIANAIRLRRAGIIPSIDVGVEARNEVGDDEGHEWVVGPSLSIELPIFDPGAADLARLRAQLRQAEHELRAKAIAVRSEIRVQRERLVTARRRVDYLRETVLPRREAIDARSLEQYNGMLIGAYELLELRGEHFEAEGMYADALAEYWSARAELERAVGGSL